MNIDNVLIVIPARYASVRFPGKPLALIGNKPMVQWVYENAAKTTCDVVIATDDERIMNATSNFNANAVLTSPDHPSGTDRCLEAAQKFSAKRQKKYEIIVNVQGDEPFIHPNQILALVKCFSDDRTDIATLISEVDKTEAYEAIEDANKVKVVKGTNGNALYFSRSPIPFCRGIDTSEWISTHQYYTHIGMYAYRLNVLESITKITPSALELTEKLEQLRWLENGFTIKTAITTQHSIGVDTPEDLKKANLLFSKNH